MILACNLCIRTEMLNNIDKEEQKMEQFYEYSFEFLKFKFLLLFKGKKCRLLFWMLYKEFDSMKHYGW